MRKRKSSDAGASQAGKIGIRDGTVRLASDIRPNDYVDFKGKPFRVIDVETTERGFCHFRAINILDGYIVPRILHSSKEIVIADVNYELYQLIGISSKDNSVTLLHYGGDYVRDDIKLPESQLLRSMMVSGFDHGKKVFVTIAFALGKEAVYAVRIVGKVAFYEVRIDQTDSAISFKRNEDAVNQSKTNDSDYVVNQSKTKKSDVVVNQNKTKDSDVVVVNQSKTNNSDLAKKACLKEKATKAKYGYEYAQRSYRDVVLGHNAAGEEIY
ncbi:Eukaryotic translation initiation factor 5A-2 [Cardamine amara subsp. amara]|uniref:Eukaryotic translation initiation factor 5A-2 n=1 Tax=Cardamine amara subsp. amara TaxID=228776 RepID=A0ABD1ASL1_CARAN